jgi:N-acetylglucosaminylphosphatidylinositol deacetylase
MKKNSEKNLLFISTPNDYILNIRAMFEHKTQLLWFRYLYIISSRYMFINYLVLIE